MGRGGTTPTGTIAEQVQQLYNDANNELTYVSKSQLVDVEYDATTGVTNSVQLTKIVFTQPYYAYFTVYQNGYPIGLPIMIKPVTGGYEHVHKLYL